jgi:hypothetical protein
MAISKDSANANIFKEVESAFSGTNWNDYPIVFCAEEQRTLSISSDGRAVLLGGGRSPCEIVGIKPEDLARASPELLKIDRAYLKAIGDYKIRGILAAERDLSIINQRLRESAERGSTKIEYIKDIFLWFVRSISREQIGQKSRVENVKKNIRNEASSNRRAWIHAVNTLEGERMKLAKTQICACCEILVPKIQKMLDESEIDMKLVEEFEQLVTLYTAFFPDLQLQVAERDVLGFLEQVRSETREV